LTRDMERNIQEPYACFETSLQVGQTIFTHNFFEMITTKQDWFSINITESENRYKNEQRFTKKLQLHPQNSFEGKTSIG